MNKFFPVVLALLFFSGCTTVKMYFLDGNVNHPVPYVKLQ